MAGSLMFRTATGNGRRYWHVWCPGCEEVHSVSDHWTVTEHDGGTLTVDPSILLTRPPLPDRCHSYLRGGVWEFLGDSTHALAGQKVPMVPLPDYMQDTADGE